MATVRYQVDGVPQDSWAHAWMPTPGVTPAASSNQRHLIRGFPGTMRVPSPAPAGSARMSTSPRFRSWSESAPPWFAPQVWYDDLRGGRPVAPTPAGTGIGYLPHRRAITVPPVVPQGPLGPLGPSKVAMGGRKVGGRRSMHWPRALLRWPNLRGEY